MKRVHVLLLARNYDAAIARYRVIKQVARLEVGLDTVRFTILAERASDATDPQCDGIVVHRARRVSAHAAMRCIRRDRPTLICSADPELEPVMRKVGALSGIPVAAVSLGDAAASALFEHFVQTAAPNKVVLACVRFPPTVGGTSVFNSMVADQLYRHGVEVSVVAYFDADSARGYPAYGVWGLPLVRYVRFARALRRCAQDAQMIFVTSPISAGIPVMLAGLNARKVLYMMGDLPFELLANRGYPITIDSLYSGRTPLSLLTRLLMKWLLSQSHALAFNARDSFYKRILDRYVHKVLRTGYVGNPSLYITAEAPPRGEYLLFVGWLLPLKQVDMLLRALVHLPAKKLVIVGDGPAGPRLRAMTRALGLDSRVIFKGALSQEELSDVYRGAEALVLPSLSDVGPRVIQEAKAHHLPVIATIENGFADLCDVTFDPKSEAELVAAINRLPLQNVKPLTADYIHTPEDLFRQVIDFV